jgi:hypothetical protein
VTRLYSVLLLWLIAASESGALAASGFESFFAEFRAALERNDAKAVADRTKLPFLFDGKPRDHGGFQKIYPDLFDRKVRACFKGAKAVTEGDRFVVNCGRYIFYFGLAGEHYRLFEFAADPEAAP